MRLERILYTWWLKLKESTWVFSNELRRVFCDPGVTVIFVVATIAYPILYNCIYWKDNVENIPVAVVDLSCSPESRDFLHRWNACPEVTLTHTCASMAEAERLLRDQKVHGIIYFPTDFAKALNSGLETAHISLYCDMSSFLYMKGIYLSCNKVMLESMNGIQIDRYEAMGMNEEFAWSLVQEAPYTETALFCPSGGYAAFLIPAVLMLILHQTLFFGICMLGGTAREENEEPVPPARCTSCQRTAHCDWKGRCLLCDLCGAERVCPAARTPFVRSAAYRQPAGYHAIYGALPAVGDLLLDAGQHLYPQP